MYLSATARAAFAGDASAQHTVAETLMLEGDASLALTFLESAAQQHYAPSLLKLAHLTKAGDLGAHPLSPPLLLSFAPAPPLCAPSHGGSALRRLCKACIGVGREGMGLCLTCPGQK